MQIEIDENEESISKFESENAVLQKENEALKVVGLLVLSYIGFYIGSMLRKPKKT